MRSLSNRPPVKNKRDVAVSFYELYNQYGGGKKVSLTPALKQAFNSRFCTTRGKYPEMTTEDFCACILWGYKTNPNDYLTLASYGNHATLAGIIPQFLKWKRGAKEEIKESGLSIYDYVDKYCSGQDNEETIGLTLSDYERVYSKKRG